MSGLGASANIRRLCSSRWASSICWGERGSFSPGSGAGADSPQPAANANNSANAAPRPTIRDMDRPPKYRTPPHPVYRVAARPDSGPDHFTHVHDEAGVYDAVIALADVNGTSSSASASTTVQGAVLQVAVSAPPTVALGGRLTYAITVTNAGSGEAANVGLTDAWPAGTSFVSQSQASGPAFALATSMNYEVSDTIAYLAPGASAVLDVVALASAGDANNSVLHDTAAVSATGASSVSASASTTVLVPSPTTTGLSSSANPSAFGQPITLTAIVSHGGAGYPTGQVQFRDGANFIGTAALSNGQATLTLSTLAVGSHSLTAVYQGDPGDSISTSAAVGLTVGQASTTTSLTSGADPSILGQSVTLTAEVDGAFGGAPTGTVTFLSGATTLGTGTLSPGGDGGQATLTLSTLPVGTDPITAVYGGDADSAGGGSSAFGQVVQPLPTTTALTSGADPSTFGQSVTLTATVSNGTPTQATGTVEFDDGGNMIGTGTLSSSGQATFVTSSLTAGGHSLTAIYYGDSSNAGSTSSVVNQTVQQASTTTALTSVANPSDIGQAVTLTAEVDGVSGGTPSGTITFMSGETVLGTGTLAPGGNGSQATLTLSTLPAGTDPVTASYGGDAIYGGIGSPTLTQVVENNGAFVWTEATCPKTTGRGGQLDGGRPNRHDGPGRQRRRDLQRRGRERPQLLHGRAGERQLAHPGGALRRHAQPHRLAERGGHVRLRGRQRQPARRRGRVRHHRDGRLQLGRRCPGTLEPRWRTSTSTVTPRWEEPTQPPATTSTWAVP